MHRRFIETSFAILLSITFHQLEPHPIGLGDNTLGDKSPPLIATFISGPPDVQTQEHHSSSIWLKRINTKIQTQENINPIIQFSSLVFMLSHLNPNSDMRQVALTTSQRKQIYVLQALCFSRTSYKFYLQVYEFSSNSSLWEVYTIFQRSNCTLSGRFQPQIILTNLPGVLEWLP